MRVAALAIVLACGWAPYAVAAGYDDLNTAIEIAKVQSTEKSLPFFESAISAGDLVPSQKAIAYLGAGRAHYVKKEFAEALTAFNKAVELAPNLRLARSYRADVYLALNNPEAAKQDYDALVAAVPANAEIRWARSLLLERENDYTGSLSNMMVVLDAQFQPNRLVDMYFRIGMLNFHLGRLEEAQEYLEKVVGLYPADDYSWLWLANIRAKQGKSVPRASSLPKAGWPRPLIDYFLGDATLDQVVELTKQEKPTQGYSPACDMDYFVGGWAAIHGDQNTANSLLDNPVENCNKANFAWAKTGFAPNGH